MLGMYSNIINKTEHYVIHSQFRERIVAAHECEQEERKQAEQTFAILKLRVLNVEETRKFFIATKQRRH